MTTDVAIGIHNISKSFGGVKALDGVTFDIRVGEVLCFAGENGSGKSTLIKIVAGVVQADSGEIVLGSQRHRSLSPMQAISAGIEVIYQDLSLLPNLTVAENIALPGLLASHRLLVSRAAIRATARATAHRIGAEFDLDRRVEDLGIADRQLAAICRALASDARVLFMDEPTTALTRREVDRLFVIVHELRSLGVATVFVSHKLDEIVEIAQRIVIIRDGRVVAQGEIKDFDRTRITKAMTGRDVSGESTTLPASVGGQPVLSVRSLGLESAFRGVSFDLHAGEIVGITGLLGSGRTELAESLFGIRPPETGTIEVLGRTVHIRSARDAVKAGLGYVPDDRLAKGLFLEHAIGKNIVAATIDRYANRVGWLRRTRLAEAIRRWIDDLRIKTLSPELPVRSLSGGNQQRVLLAKWLAASPRVLILSGPTVGVDVGSKQEILELLRQLAANRMAILVFSDDIPELVQVSSRVLVMHRGQIAHELREAELDHDRIAKLLVA